MVYVYHYKLEIFPKSEDAETIDGNNALKPILIVDGIYSSLSPVSNMHNYRDMKSKIKLLNDCPDNPSAITSLSLIRKKWFSFSLEGISRG